MLAGLEDTALDATDRTPPGPLRSSKPGEHMTGTQPSCAGRIFFFFWSRGDESGNLDSLVSDFHEVLCTFFFFKEQKKKVSTCKYAWESLKTTLLLQETGKCSSAFEEKGRGGRRQPGKWTEAWVWAWHASLLNPCSVPLTGGVTFGELRQVSVCVICTMGMW